MKDFITKFPTMKQLEQLLLRKLQEQFAIADCKPRTYMAAA